MMATFNLKQIRFARQNCLRLVAVSVVVVAVPLVAAAKPTVSARNKPKTLPKFDAVKAEVERQLRGVRSYKPGDVLSRGSVEPIFGKLANLGWVVSDRKEIIEQLLPDDYYLVRALRSPNNSEFLRHVAQMPDGAGYDRLDRLSRMGDGEIIVSRLMQEPGGWNLVDIMSQSREAPGMAQALSMGPGGKDFTKPTGRIYTEQQFLARLKQSYDKASQSKSPSPTSQRAAR
jgi:hypothetical protein